MCISLIRLLLWIMALHPFPKQQNLDSSKLIYIADNNFKFVENGREFSKSVGNTARKGEIAHYE